MEDYKCCCTFFNNQWQITPTWKDQLLHLHFNMATFPDHQDQAQIQPAEHDVKPTEVTAANAYDVLFSMLQPLKDKNHNLLAMVQELQQCHANFGTGLYRMTGTNHFGCQK